MILDRLFLFYSEIERTVFVRTLCEPRTKPLILSFVNAHAFTLAARDKTFQQDLLAANYLLRDGIGMSVLLRLLGKKPGLNMNGTDLIPEIVERFAGKKVALCGTSDPWLSQAANKVSSMGTTVVFSTDGFQKVSTYVDALVKAKPDLIILAMGMPRQEKVAACLSKRIHGGTVIVNGGAILDFMGGRFPRAPRMWRTAKLEWLYRLIQEPRRLAKRYIAGGVVFSVMALRLVLVQKFRGASLK